MDPSHPPGSVTICRQCLHYADLLGRNIAQFRVFDPGTLAALVKEIEERDIACACEILRSWGIWGQLGKAPLSRDPVWLSELPPRSVTHGLDAPALSNKRKKMLRELRPDSSHLAAGWNLCRCVRDEVCSICSGLRDEEDDAHAGREA